MKDIPRNTCQAMVLIIFKTCENSFGALHNRMVVNRPIFKAYGNGEYLGMSKCLRRMEGWFPENTGVATICFESEDLALKCLDSKTPMREPNWMSGPEIYVIPLCNSMWRFNGKHVSRKTPHNDNSFLPADRSTLPTNRHVRR